MKKILSVILAALMLLSLFAACGEKAPATTDDAAAAPAPAGADVSAPGDANDEENTDKETTEIAPPDAPVIITTDPASASGGGQQTAPSSGEEPSGDDAPESSDEQTPASQTPAAQTPAQAPAQTPSQTPAQTPAAQIPQGQATAASKPLTGHTEAPAVSKTEPHANNYQVHSTGTDVNIGFLGDGILIEAANMVGSFGLEDNILLPIYGANQGYNNICSNYTYSAYDIYGFDGAVMTKPSKRMVGLFDPDEPKVDAFVCLVSRDRALQNETNETKMILSIQDMYTRLITQNPNGKFVLLVPPAYLDGCTFFSEKMEMPNLYGKEHDKRIRAFAEKVLKVAPTSQVIQLGDAFDFYNANYASSGINLFMRDKRSPNLAGAYFIAGVIYGSLFGKSVYGMEFNPALTDEEIKVLQSAAHEFVFGSKPTAATGHNKTTYPIITLDDDPRFKNQKYPNGFNELLATAFAYYDRHWVMSYDVRSIDRAGGYVLYRRTVDGTGVPEYATPQRTLYLDCTAFVWSLLKATFDYSLPRNRSKPLTYDTFTGLLDLVVWEKHITSDLNIRDTIDSFLETLEPGDVIAVCCPNGDRGHGVIYLGNGYVMQCSNTSRISGSSADYNWNGKVDTFEYYGGIRVDKIDFMTDPNRMSFEFDPSYDIQIRIIRPPYSKLTPTEDAVNRYKNMQHIIAHKLTSAPDGVSVNPGDAIDYTIVVQNLNNEPRTVAVTDTLPAGLTLTAGSNNFTLSLAAGETKSQTYTVTVSPSAKKGEIIEYNTTKAGGVTLASTPVYVANTLTAAEKQKFVSAVEAASGSTTFDLIKAGYDALGYTLPFTSADAAKDILLIPHTTEKYAKAGAFMPNENGKATNMVVRGLYGGEFLMPYSKAEILGNKDRIKYLHTRNLVAGDIIYVLEENNEKRSSALYLYLGNDTLVYVSNGKKVYVKDTSGCKELIERIWGEEAFFVLRPSLAR